MQTTSARKQFFGTMKTQVSRCFEIEKSISKNKLIHISSIKFSKIGNVGLSILCILV